MLGRGGAFAATCGYSKPHLFLSTTFFRRLNIAVAAATDSSISVPLGTAAEAKVYSNLLRRCSESSNLFYGKAIHAKLITKPNPLPFYSSSSSSLYLHNHVLNFYVKCGLLDDALELFDRIPHRNVVSWSALLAGFVQRNCPGEALSLFCRMHREALVPPNEFTLVSALQASSFSEDSVWLYLIYAFVIRSGFESNVFLINAFITGLVRHGMLLDAKMVFDECVNKDIVSWNAMMAGLLQHCYAQIPAFWLRMSFESVKPDHFTFATVFAGLASLFDLKMGMQVHGQLVKSGHGGCICVGNSLSDMYIKNQRMSDALKAFLEMPLRNVRSWTQMAVGSLQCGEPGKALELNAEMRGTGIMPNKFTLSTALNACANLASFEEGKKLHGLRIKVGSLVDVVVDNALLDMYTKCGFMDGAWVIFRSMHDRSDVTWETMILGCAQNGQPDVGLEIFEEMTRQGVKPNCVTFICVLYACSQGGFVAEGWNYFSSMSCDHGISPGEDHYACMVDILGRAGHIKEAEDLILNMPFQPGLLVWQTLLSTCNLHGDIQKGKWAAEHAMDLDGKDSKTYVLFSNMFSCLSNWDAVGMLRKAMKNRDVQKMPGSSWIELEDAH